ncbi:MAG: peptidase, partial [Anaerolineae bacterium]|nr:peptidase [Anaerolineae bacterium]
VGLDWSWFIVFFLITWSLAAHYFPMNYPDWSPGLYWLVGLLTSLLFFGSVLAHELSHSLVARSTGTPVHGITLFIFGGVAQIAAEPKRPRDEFWMALAGPAMSLALALLFGLIWFGTRDANQPVAALASWLGW